MDARRPYPALARPAGNDYRVSYAPSPCGGWVATVRLHGRVMFSVLAPSERAAEREAADWCERWRDVCWQRDAEMRGCR